MTAESAAQWMVSQLSRDGCLYQDDVVDYLVREKADDFLRENDDGNLVISTEVLAAFRKLTPDNVVWVRPDLYWRFRVPEDEPGRDARG